MAATSFYKELHHHSTADYYAVANKKKRRKLKYGGNYFTVDRVIAERSERDVSMNIILLSSFSNLLTLVFILMRELCFGCVNKLIRVCMQKLFRKNQNTLFYGTDIHGTTPPTNLQAILRDLASGTVVLYSV